MLLEALVACAGVTLKAVATAMGINLTDASVHAEGDLDFRGTLAVNREAKVGFRDIRLQFSLQSEAPPRGPGQADPVDRALLRGITDPERQRRFFRYGRLRLIAVPPRSLTVLILLNTNLLTE